jgi:hypothetical protein
MSFPLRCRCGSLEGYVGSTHKAGRATCYCRDCQAFARYLGAPELTLDADGGTDIVATSPRCVRFTHGKQHLRCMSLSPRGLLRWYAGCCRTPIGNTPRNPRLSYVGLVHDCLAGSESAKTAAFGPPRVAVNTKSAKGKVSPTPLPTFFAGLKILRNVLSCRLTGKYRENPFFNPGTSEPIAVPTVLTLAERRALTPRGEG